MPESREAVTSRHWRDDVTYDSTDPHVLGEDERGELWAPSLTRRGYWDRQFSPWRPTHWRAYLRTRRLNRLAFIEYVAS